MTRDDIIRMAREAGLSNDFGKLGYPYLPELERFANLVAAAERNRTWSQDHWTEYELGIAAAEREVCAQICGEVGEHPSLTPRHCAEAIRARGQV